MSVSFQTNVNDNIFILIITTENQGLIDLANLIADFLDGLFKCQFSCKVSGSYRFNFDFEEFISKQDYNFYNMLVNNCEIQLKWSVW